MKSPKVWLVAFLGMACVGCGEKPLALYTSPAGKFKVMFPGGAPKTQSVSGQKNVQVSVYSVEGFSYGYVVTHYDFPADKDFPEGEASQKEGLATEVDGLFSGSQGQKATSSMIKLQDKYHGMEYTGTWKKPKSLNGRGRVIFVGRRVFNIVVAGSPEKVNSEMATQFLNSFKAD